MTETTTTESTSRGKPRHVTPGGAPEGFDARLVLKALDVINNGRLEFDAGQTDIAASFLAIKKTLTPSGRQVTYQAGRSEETSHSDLAWATMHALFNEPLEGVSASNSSKMEMF